MKHSLYTHLRSCLVRLGALWRSRAVWLVAGAVLLGGCTQTVSDTEGHRFAIDCENSPCRLTQEKTDSPPAYRLLSSDRLLQACPEGADQTPYDCRPLTCDSASACSKLGGPDFSCVAGLCQASKRDISADDRLALCLAGTGAWTKDREQQTRATLALACRPPCTVPAQCRQP